MGRTQAATSFPISANHRGWSQLDNAPIPYRSGSCSELCRDVMSWNGFALCISLL